MKTPRKELVKAARVEAGLTQQRAAEVVRVDLRTWQRWEYGEREMPLSTWDLFNHMKYSIVHRLEAIKDLHPDKISVYPNYSTGNVSVWYQLKKHGLAECFEIDFKGKTMPEIIKIVEDGIREFRAKFAHYLDI